MQRAPFDTRVAVSERHAAIQQAILAVVIAALAMGAIALAATPGLMRVERAEQNARV